MKHKRERSRIRQGEPSDCYVGLTWCKARGNIGGWGRRPSDWYSIGRRGREHRVEMACI